MAGLLSALRFVIGSTMADPWRGPRAETVLEGASRGYEADVYAPRGRSRGVVLFLHGMSLRGHRDPRQVRVCRVLAGSGYRVIAPRIPSLSELRLSDTLDDELVEVIDAVHARPDLGGGAPIGLFSVSYSAAVCLVAAARPELAGRVAAVCAIGTFADGLGWARWVIEDSGEDDYARLILVRHLAGLTLGISEGVSGALVAAVADHHPEDGRPGWAEALRGLDEDERALAGRLRHDREFGRSLLRTAHEQARLAGLRRLSPADAAPRLRVPVALLHGATDDVVPPAESVALHALLASRGAPARLVVTRLLTHGDTRVGPELLGEAVALVRTFAHFFAAVDAQRPARSP